MIEVWNKEIIKNLDQIDIEQWFDVLNNGLVEDRGYSLTDSKIDDIKSTIKMDYINYLKSCPLNSQFQSYFLRNNNSRIVSVCRIVKTKEGYYLEGLETHKDYQKQGFATELVNQMIYALI